MTARPRWTQPTVATHMCHSGNAGTMFSLFDPTKYITTFWNTAPRCVFFPRFSASYGKIFDAWAKRFWGYKLNSSVNIDKGGIQFRELAGETGRKESASTTLYYIFKCLIRGYASGLIVTANTAHFRSAHRRETCNPTSYKTERDI